MEKSNFDEKIKEKLIENFLSNTKNIQEKSTSVPELRLKRFGKNKFVSDKIEVRHGPGVGRHVVAVEDIEAGEVLVQETPLSSVLHVSKLSSNCSSFVLG